MLQSPVLFLRSDQRETTHVGDGARSKNRITGCLDFPLSPLSQMDGEAEAIFHSPWLWENLKIGLGVSKSNLPWLQALGALETTGVSGDCQLLNSSYVKSDHGFPKLGDYSAV